MLPTPPASVAAVFPEDRLALVQRYAERLATDGVVRGLIGPRETPRLWQRHLVNCALLAPALPEGSSVADVGSGAGLPGLVLALARPDVRITLIEPLLRRTTFLQEVVDELGLSHVTVRRDRADALHGTEQYDVVTARAVAPLESLLGWCMPLVAPTGSLLAMKGESAEAEVAAAAAYWRKLGCAEPTVELLGNDLDPSLGVDPVRIVRVSWANPARVSLPRPGGGRSASRKAGARGSHRAGTRNKRRKS